MDHLFANKNRDRPPSPSLSWEGTRADDQAPLSVSRGRIYEKLYNSFLLIKLSHLIIKYFQALPQGSYLNFPFAIHPIFYLNNLFFSLRRKMFFVFYYLSGFGKISKIFSFYSLDRMLFKERNNFIVNLWEFRYCKINDSSLKIAFSTPKIGTKTIH